MSANSLFARSDDVLRVYIRLTPLLRARPQKDNAAVSGNSPPPITRRRRWIWRIFPWIALMVVSALLVLLAERVHPHADGLFQWLNTNRAAAFCNFALAFCWLAFFVLLFNRFFFGLLLAAGSLTLLMLISAGKYAFLHAPLYPSDFLMTRNVLQLASHLLTWWQWSLLAGLPLLACSALFWERFLPRIRFRAWIRIIGILLTAGVFLGVAFVQDDLGVTFLNPLLGIHRTQWYPPDEYQRNGFLLSFTFNLDAVTIKKPSDYNAQAIAAIARQYATPSAPLRTDAAQQPNIVFVLNEAFWDPTLLPNTTFSEDPIPTFHRLGKTQISGNHLSCTAGGGTSNVEFELLTSLSMNSLPLGVLPFYHYIRDDLPALPWVFAQQGYQTIAIHPFQRWFYNRDQVYPKLGFEEFQALDDFPDAPISGTFVSDAFVTSRILQVLRASQQPRYVHVVTMQNHGPYDAPRYNALPIRVSNPSLTAQELNCLSVYTEGVRQADAALHDLIEGLAQLPRPTILVFTGDHTPYLGPDFEIFRKTGFMSNAATLSATDLRAIKTVPFVIWRNTDTENHIELGTFRTAMFAPHLLELAGLDHPFFRNFLSQVQQPVTDYETSLLGAHELPPENPSYHQYHLINYDILFGKRYSASAFFSPNPNVALLMQTEKPSPGLR